MLIDHCLLDGMERAIGAAQMFDGDQMGAVQAAHETDAGGDRVVDNLVAMEAPDEHGAGAAIALGAAFLGAAQALFEPKPIEQRRIGLDIGEADLLVVENEPNGTRNFALGSAPPIS
jgi:hypothetical protein